MKAMTISAVLLFSIFTINTSSAQTAVKNDTIKVWGNCGMCKTTIEKAAKKTGAKTASWDEDSKLLKVSYTPAKTSSVKIQQAIANAGYDTQDFTGNDKAYDNLHGCCQYERKSATDKEKKKCCENEKCGKGAEACKDTKCCADKTCCKS